jgi:hypothetical protein
MRLFAGDLRAAPFDRGAIIKSAKLFLAAEGLLSQKIDFCESGEFSVTEN